MLSLFETLGKRGNPVCLEKVYEALWEYPVDENGETRGDRNGIYVGETHVIGLETSREEGPEGYAMKKAFVRCACGKCDSKAIILHLSGELKKGHKYRVEGTPTIRHWGTLEIQNTVT